MAIPSTTRTGPFVVPFVENYALAEGYYPTYQNLHTTPS